MTTPPPDPHDELAGRVRALLRDVPDFPAPGILFKDFTPLLADADALRALVDDIAGRYDGRVDAVAGIEARGFVLGAAVAYRLGIGFVPVRKAGKLPPETHAVSYALEYGEATLEVATSSFGVGQRVLVVDDVLATGGTAAAACALVERTGAVVVAVDVVLEIGFLPGRAALPGREVHSLVTS
ncbi:adenine phosphoribosyltransferase [Dermatophilaceae bacterium Soc4.6]